MVLSTGPCSLERREQNRVAWEGRSALSYTFEGQVMNRGHLAKPGHRSFWAGPCRPKLGQAGEAGGIEAMPHGEERGRGGA